MAGGSWSFVSGPMPPSLITAGLPSNQMNATNMTMPGTYCFRWSISNPPCVASTDDVCVTVSPVTVGGGVSANATVCEGCKLRNINFSWICRECSKMGKFNEWIFDSYPDWCGNEYIIIF